MQVSPVGTAVNVQFPGKQSDPGLNNKMSRHNTIRGERAITPDHILKMEADDFGNNNKSN